MSLLLCVLVAFVAGVVFGWIALAILVVCCAPEDERPPKTDRALSGVRPLHPACAPSPRSQPSHWVGPYPYDL